MEAAGNLKGLVRTSGQHDELIWIPKAQGFEQEIVTLPGTLIPKAEVVAMAVAVIISMIAGIYPAWKASKMEPIDALRTL